MLDEDKKKSAKSNNFRAYALVMSANFEAVAIFVSTWYFSQYLQEHYAISKNRKPDLRCCACSYLQVLVCNVSTTN